MPCLAKNKGSKTKNSFGITGNLHFKSNQPQNPVNRAEKKYEHK